MSFKLNDLFVFTIISSLTLCSIPPISIFAPWDDPDDRLLPENERNERIVNNNSLTQYWTHPTDIDLRDFKKKYLKGCEKCEAEELRKKKVSKGSKDSKK